MTMLLVVADVVRRTGLAKATLAKLRVNGGGPPFVKVGAKVLYRENELEAWIAALLTRTSTSDIAPSQQRRGRLARAAR